MKHFFTFLIVLLSISLGQSQTEIVNQTLTSGSLPTGWSQTSVVFVTSAGGYARFDNTSADLTSELFDASSYSSIDVDFDVAKFGSGNNGPITLEYSTNGGTSWVVAGNSSTPTSSSYLSNNISITTLSSTMRIRFTRASSPSQKRLRNVVITGFGSAGTTSVEFATTSVSVSEGVGTYDLTLSITNEDMSSDTTCDVVLITGDAADIDSYTTQMVTFPANTSTDQNVTITVTDDGLFEGDETVTFQIQNVAGGSSAAVGTNDEFDLTIEDNDPDPSITVFIEDFDGSFPKWSNDIESQLFVDPSTPSEGLFIQAASSNNANFAGNTAFGRDLDGESGEPDLSPYTFTFSSVDVSDYTSIVVSFDYHAFANAETGDYEVVIDGVGQGSVEYFNDPDTSPGVDGTITIPVANGTSTVGLILTGTLNGGSDVIEFDNFKITGIYSGLVYSGGSWSPSDPDGSSGASDAIIVDGTAIISSDVSINDLTVYPGAALQVDTGFTLTSSSITLESKSDSYSSLILDGSITGTVNYNRAVNSFTADATNNDNDLIAAPLSGITFGTFDSANANLFESGSARAFATFNNDTGAYVNFDATTDAGTSLVDAEGYRAATTDGETLTFTGTVNTGLVDIDINIGTDATYPQWNLIGNPYPSYIDADVFLNHVVSTATSGETNVDLTESGIYGYDGDATNGWDIITLANSSGRLLAPGQGFFVAADGTGTLIADHNIEFTDAMKTTGTSDDFILGRNSSPLTFLELKASTANNNYSTEFYFNANSSRELDRGYDAKLFGGIAPDFALYSHVVENNSGLPIALQSLGETDYNDIIIPLGVNANAGEMLTFSITKNTLPSDINIYLEDNVTNTFTLLNDGDYNLLPSSALNGTGRFYLRLSSTVLSIDDANDLNGLSIYNDSNRDIVIAGELLQPTTAKIYDLQGRLVASQSLDIASREQRISTNNISTGVYIIQLSNELQNMSQKIIIR